MLNFLNQDNNKRNMNTKKIKAKIKSKKHNNDKHGLRKFVMISAAGVAVTIGVKKYMKKNNERKLKNEEMEKEEQLNAKRIKDQYDARNVLSDKEDKEDNEMKSKIEEFNKNRILPENVVHSDNKTMKNHIEAEKTVKPEINAEEYKEDAYDKYDQYEEELNKKQ